MRTSLSKPGKLILVPVSIVLAVIMIVVMLPVAASADIHSVCRLYGPITLNSKSGFRTNQWGRSGQTSET